MVKELVSLGLAPLDYVTLGKSLNLQVLFQSEKFCDYLLC